MAEVPGKVIFAGEHAAPHGLAALAVAIDYKTKASISSNFKQSKIYSVNYNESKVIDFGDEELYLRYCETLKEGGDISEFQTPWFNPIMCLLGKYEHEHNLMLFGKYKLEIGDNERMIIPKGCGSGSATGAAIMAAIDHYFTKKVDLEKILDYTLFFDDIMHGGKSSGLDAHTVVKGGWIYYDGLNFEKIELPHMKFLLVDSKVNAKTSEQTNNLEELLKAEPGRMKDLEKIGKITEEVIKWLKQSNLGEVGKLFYKNHEILKSLGLSCNELDKIVDISKNIDGVYGAKMTGAGGGGSAIILGKNLEKIKRELSNKYRIKSSIVSTVNQGVEI